MRELTSIENNDQIICNLEAKMVFNGNNILLNLDLIGQTFTIMNNNI